MTEKMSTNDPHSASVEPSWIISEYEVQVALVPMPCNNPSFQLLKNVLDSVEYRQ